MIDLRTTKTYMINLDKDQHEFPKMEKEFAKLGIQVDRLSGVYGKGLSKEYIDSIVHPYALHTINTEVFTPWDVVSLGAVGCSLSHVKAWQTLVDSDEKLIHVLEDDALPTSDVEKMNQFINDVEKIDPEWDVIYLGYFGFKMFNPDRKLPYGVLRIKSAMPGAQSYLISKAGARKLLQHAFPLVNAIDTYMSLSFMYRDVRAYRYKSSFVKQTRTAAPGASNIQTKISARPAISIIPQSVTLTSYLVTLCVLVYFLRKFPGPISIMGYLAIVYGVMYIFFQIH
jgi:glycosyl transferase, family 25